MMTSDKQEEIKAGVIVNIVMACPSMLNRDIEALADKILKDENSQGVVIRVDRELPLGHWTFQIPAHCIDWINERKGYREAQQEMLKAGYVATERLLDDA